MTLSYYENETLFLYMELLKNGNCEIRLCEKIKNNEKECEYGRRVYSHECFEISKNTDFNIYYRIKELMKEENFKEKIQDFLKIQLYN